MEMLYHFNVFRKIVLCVRRDAILDDTYIKTWLFLRENTFMIRVLSQRNITNKKIYYRFSRAGNVHGGVESEERHCPSKGCNYNRITRYGLGINLL